MTPRVFARVIMVAKELTMPSMLSRLKDFVRSAYDPEYAAAPMEDSTLMAAVASCVLLEDAGMSFEVKTDRNWDMPATMTACVELVDGT